MSHVRSADNSYDRSLVSVMFRTVGWALGWVFDDEVY